jgi:hypothetical protein
MAAGGLGERVIPNVTDPVDTTETSPEAFIEPLYGMMDQGRGFPRTKVLRRTKIELLRRKSSTKGGS